MKPKRIQRRRVKGWKMPENTVSITRPGKWGNPFKVGHHINEKIVRITDPLILDECFIVKDKAHAIELYRMYITGDYKTDYLKKAASMLYELTTKKFIIKELKGKNLACFCREGEPCHGDVLLKIANEI
jgi:hypothetical protein